MCMHIMLWAQQVFAGTRMCPSWMKKTALSLLYPSRVITDSPAPNPPQPPSALRGSRCSALRPCGPSPPRCWFK